MHAEGFVVVVVKKLERPVQLLFRLYRKIAFVAVFVENDFVYEKISLFEAFDGLIRLQIGVDFAGILVLQHRHESKFNLFAGFLVFQNDDFLVLIQKQILVLVVGY